MLHNNTTDGRPDLAGNSPTGEWQIPGYTFLDSLLQPDCILPSQFHRRRQAAQADGEIKLLIAVLQDAINTYVRTIEYKSPSQREQFNEVDFWFHGPSQKGLFAFETVCEVLGIEARRIRRWLAAVRAGGIGAHLEVSTDGRIRKRRGLRIRLSERGRHPRPLGGKRACGRTEASRQGESQITNPVDGRDIIETSA